MAKKKSAQKQDQPPMFGYQIAIESYCDYSERSNEAYGSWEESWTNSLGSVAKKNPQVADVVSIHDIQPGQNALVVWVEWDSGDSFGRGYRKYTEIIGLFKDLTSARSLVDQIHNWKPGGKKYKAYEFRTPDGQVFRSGFAPWSGYFDSLSDVRVDTVAVF